MWARAWRMRRLRERPGGGGEVLVRVSFMCEACFHLDAYGRR